MLQLDPAFHIAYTHLNGTSERYGNRYGCVTHPVQGFCTTWIAVLRPSGDTLIEVPVLVEKNPAARDAQRELAIQERSKPAMWRLAKQDMQAWIDVAPNEARAHFQLARVLSDLGETERADEQLRRVNPAQDPNIRATLFQSRTDVAIKLGRAAEGRAWFDSIVAGTPDRPGNTWRRGSWVAMFGEFTRFRAWIAQNPNRTTEEVAYISRLPRVMLGVGDDAMVPAERAYFEAKAAPACGHRCREERIVPSLAYGLRIPRTTWPALTDSSRDERLLPAKALAAHDTAALRRAAVRLDAAARRNVAAGELDLQGWGIIAGESYLVLGDTVRALALARFWVDTAMRAIPLFSSVGDEWPGAPVLWPHAMLLRAELSGALGFNEESRKWYTRVIDLWKGADPELQPVVERLRKSRAALGAAP